LLATAPFFIELNEETSKLIAGGNYMLPDAKQRRDIWSLLQNYTDRASEQFCKTSTLAQVAKLEQRWLQPGRGIVARLMRRPTLSKAKATAQKVFLECLEQHVRNQARYAKLWLDE